jgi:hypothetical protein
MNKQIMNDIKSEGIRSLVSSTPSNRASEKYLTYEQQQIKEMNKAMLDTNLLESKLNSLSVN